MPSDNELDRSPPGTSPGKSNKTHDVIEMVSAMDGTAYPSRMDRPVAVADSAGAGGPAVAMDGTAYPSRMDRPVAVADSSGAGGPVVAGTRFLAVAEVYSPSEEVKDDLPEDDRIVTRTSDTLEEDVGSHPLEHSGVENREGPSHGPQRIRPLEHSGSGIRSTENWKLADREPLEHSVPRINRCREKKTFVTDAGGQSDEGEAIIVGAVGSAAPWFLAGWTNEIEVEFMIDTGCQMTILATSVFERMCAADPPVRAQLRLCVRRLVSADSSPLTVIGELELEVVFPGRQCGQCRRPDCPVSAADAQLTDVENASVLIDQPFASSEMGDSMDADLLPQLSGETWVASALLEELTADLSTAGTDIDLIVASQEDSTLQTVRTWIQSGSAPPWSECAGLSPELRCWRLQTGNLSVDAEGRLWRRRAPLSEGSQLVVPYRERQDLIQRFHDSLFAGHLGVTRTVFRLQNRVYWPGIRRDVRDYIAACTICLARKSPCPRRSPMGHVEVGHRWDRVAMDLLDMSVTTSRGNRYVLVMVDCFSIWTEACPLSDKTAQSVADAFFNQVVCRFGMPIVIHSDQGREFENRIMQELCILCGSHKTRTTLYHPESDGLVERFNRTLLMMLAMFASKNREDWDDLLPPVMMAYRSSVHESTGFSPYRLMFGEECTLPMDIGLPKQQNDVTDNISSPYAVWVRDALEEAYEQVRRYSGQVVWRQKRLYDRRAVRRLFAVGDWVLRYYTPAKKCKLDSAWVGPYLVISITGWALGIRLGCSQLTRCLAI